MTHPDLSARSAIDRALLHDRDALEEVLLLRYEWLQEVAEKTIPSSLREKVSVEDVLEESFVRIFRGFLDFAPHGGEAGLFQWLKQVVQSAARDALRKVSSARAEAVPAIAPSGND